MRKVDVRKVYCEFCGKEVSRDAFHIWNTTIYCSTECFEKDKQIKEGFENGKETEKES